MTPADPLDPVEALRRIAEGVEHWDAERDADSISVLWRIGDLARAALAALPAPVPEGVPEDDWPTPTDALMVARRVLQRVADEDGELHGDAISAMWIIDSAVPLSDTPHEEGEQP